MSTCLLWIPRWLSGKESACQCRRRWFDSWVGKNPWRRKWQPTPIFLPGKFHGQRSLAGYLPWDRKESNMTQRLTLHKMLYKNPEINWKYQFVHVHAQSCLTLFDPMDCSLPDYSVHEISQARILEWVVIFSSGGSSQPRIEPTSPALAGRFFTSWATGEALKM